MLPRQYDTHTPATRVGLQSPIRGFEGTRSAEERPGNRNLRLLGQLLSFLRPYRTALAGSVLGFGLVL